MIRRLVPRRIKTAIRNFILRGNNVECPICEKTFVKFLPFGVPPAQPRMNAMCPNCLSLERTRIYWKYLSEKSNLFNSKNSVLHIAPEFKLFEKFMMHPKINYFPIDKFTEGYSYPKGTKNMDLTNLKYPDNTFDFVLCSHVLEHIPNDILAMQELYRVLKPSGFGILQVPIEMDRTTTYEDHSIISPKEREKAFGQFDHVRIYGKDYIDRLKSVGFEVKIDAYANKTSKLDKFRFGFGAGELLFIVRKNIED